MIVTPFTEIIAVIKIGLSFVRKAPGKASGPIGPSAFGYLHIIPNNIIVDPKYFPALRNAAVPSVLIKSLGLVVTRQ